MYKTTSDTRQIAFYIIDFRMFLNEWAYLNKSRLNVFLQTLCLIHLKQYFHQMKRQISAKKLFQSNPHKIQKINSTVQISTPLESKSKKKSMFLQTIIDDRLEIAAYSLIIQQENTTPIQNKEKQVISQPTNDQVDQINQEQKTKDIKSSNIIIKQIQKQKTVKSRAKIFKEQLIDTIPHQIKTSLHRWTYGDGVTPSKLIICNWNVNGLRSVISKNMLNPYINSLKPDIICITETKMDERSYDVAPIYLSGYHGYFNFSKHSSGYSGVAVFSKYPPKSMSEDMAERQFSQQGRILTMQFQKIILINIYAPTTGKQLQRLKYRQKYDVAFRNHINKIRSTYPEKKILIVGDLNVAHTELDTHPGKNIMMTPSFTVAERRGLTELLNLGFVDVFRALHPETRAYTWWYVNIGGRENFASTGIGRRIDYFLIPKEVMGWVKRCDIMREVLGADHCPVELELDLNLNSKNESPINTNLQNVLQAIGTDPPPKQQKQQKDIQSDL